MKPLRILNGFTLVLTLIVNFLASYLPLNNRTTGEISALYPVLFTPDGYVFAIWGLIYLSLIGFTIYQLLPSQKDNPNLERVGIWFIAANLFNSGWIFAWHYDLIPLSMILMLGLLASLLTIFLRLNIGKTQVSTADRTFIHFPISLYLGWISVATIANASVLLYALNWNGFGIAPELWTSLVIVVGALLGIAMIRFRGGIAYPLVIIWAFAGILFKPESQPPVSTIAGLAALAILAVLAFTLLRNRQLSLIQARKNRENWR
ncbi:MAG: hypothetical protein ROW48_12060 [Bellilinea sp.]|jgi:hypothetical protein